ncbi:nitroreductase [Sphingomonas sp.]|uniref:nitroreductase n=1 Tax=Sphingomonas sp. TaxID=28214 RepID=UPI003B00D9A2
MDQGDAFSTLSHLLNERHSCRAFLTRPVSRSLIEQIVQVAQRSASWCNLQPWQVVVTEGAGTDRFRDALYAHAVEHQRAPEDNEPDIPFPTAYEGVYKERQRACGLVYYDAVGVVGDRAASALRVLENFRLFGAPHTMIVTTEADLGAYGAIDCGGFIANFILAAHSLGVATIAQAAIAMHCGFVRRYFDLPAHRQILCAVSFGYPDEKDPANSFRTARAGLEEVLTYRSD